jgi:tetratricopeptide (TPR) repeat protein
LLEVGNIESAKEKFNRILELQPDFALALFYLGEIAFDDCNYERAVQLFKQAIRQDNALTGPRYRLAQYALMKELWQEAANYLVSELKLAPDDVDTLVSMGSMFLTMGDLDYATHCMMRAIDIDCAHAQAYYYLGLINAMKGRFEESAEFFAHTLDINPDHICALRDSAVVYMAMGRLDDAAVRIKKALPLADDDPQLKTLDRRVRRLQATERISDFLCRLKP